MCPPVLAIGHLCAEICPELDQRFRDVVVVVAGKGCRDLEQRHQRGRDDARLRS